MNDALSQKTERFAWRHLIRLANVGLSGFARQKFNEDESIPPSIQI